MEPDRPDMTKPVRGQDDDRRDPAHAGNVAEDRGRARINPSQRVPAGDGPSGARRLPCSAVRATRLRDSHLSPALAAKRHLLFHTLFESGLFRQPPSRSRDKIFPMRKLIPGILLLACAAVLPAAKNLEIYSIDVEGGQSTLFVSPSRERLLWDTSCAGFHRRPCDRR